MYYSTNALTAINARRILRRIKGTNDPDIYETRMIRVRAMFRLLDGERRPG